MPEAGPAGVPPLASSASPAIAQGSGRGMRILLLGPGPNVRGPIPKLMPLLADGLRALGCEVMVLSWGRRRDRESLFGKITGRLQDIARVRSTLRRHRFDVLVVKTYHDWRTLSRDIALLASARGLGSRLVVHFHGSCPDRLVGPGQPLFKLASGILLRLSDAALVLSSEEQHQWQAFYPTRRFCVVKNPYRPPATGSTIQQAAPSARDLPAEVPVVLFAGRLIRPKGIFQLVEALPRVLAQAQCHLLMLGEGPEQVPVQERVSALGLDRHVTLTGYLEGAELQAAYRRATLFVLPSWWGEGFPFVILEALDAGLPIVTTPIRGAADHLREGIHALFVPPRDPMALSSALLRLLKDPDLRRRMGEANRAKVAEFAPLVVAREYLAALEWVVGRPSV